MLSYSCYVFQALRVSMEEQRARQEKQTQDVVQTSAEEAGVTAAAAGTTQNLCASYSFLIATI